MYCTLKDISRVGFVELLLAATNDHNLLPIVTGTHVWYSPIYYEYHETNREGRIKYILIILQGPIKE